MPHGENHAKQTVINQAVNLEAKLSNGEGADLAVHGAALLLLLQMIKPIFEARLVTDGECTDRMSNCPGHNGHKSTMNYPMALTLVSSIFGVIVLVLKLTGTM